MREIRQNMAPALPRTWAPVSTGIAFLSAVLLVLAYGNAGDFVILHDHPLPALIFWPGLWALLAVAVTMLIPSDLRSGPAIAWAFRGTGLFVLLAGCAALVASVVGVGPSGGHGDRVALVASADGRYQVEVYEWQAVLGEPGWDVVIYRRDGLRGTEAPGSLSGVDNRPAIKASVARMPKTTIARRTVPSFTPAWPPAVRIVPRATPVAPTP